MVNEYFSSIQEPVRNGSVAVGLTNVTVCDARNGHNPRKALMIRNISTNANDVITINLGMQTATANTGIVLRQYESFTDSTDINYECFQGTISGICATANGVLAIFER